MAWLRKTVVVLHYSHHYMDAELNSYRHNGTELDFGPDDSEAIERYLLNDAQRHKFVFDKSDDGRLYLSAHYYLG